MGYCDSATLERDWFNWLIASAVPALEPYRATELLWTKILGRIPDETGRLVDGFPDATHALRSHCIAFDPPIYFNSHHGIPEDTLREALLPSPCIWTKTNSGWSVVAIGGQPPIVSPDLIARLSNDGYVFEPPKNSSWQAMVSAIHLICQGVATKFRPTTDEEKNDLASRALVQVMDKLVKHKLVYTPGRAPVFNLLTTTIFRCMFSIKNKDNRYRQNINKLMADFKSSPPGATHMLRNFIKVTR